MNENASSSPPARTRLFTLGVFLLVILFVALLGMAETFESITATGATATGASEAGTATGASEAGKSSTGTNSNDAWEKYKTQIAESDATQNETDQKCMKNCTIYQVLNSTDIDLLKNAVVIGYQVFYDSVCLFSYNSSFSEAFEACKHSYTDKRALSAWFEMKSKCNGEEDIFKAYMDQKFFKNLGMTTETPVQNTPVLCSKTCRSTDVFNVKQRAIVKNIMKTAMEGLTTSIALYDNVTHVLQAAQDACKSTVNIKNALEEIVGLHLKRNKALDQLKSFGVIIFGWY
jgi:hypothetical protein